jgi:tetratricopeptide (TPR) repeat protein
MTQLMVDSDHSHSLEMLNEAVNSYENSSTEDRAMETLTLFYSFCSELSLPDSTLPPPLSIQDRKLRSVPSKSYFDEGMGTFTRLMPIVPQSDDTLKNDARLVLLFNLGVLYSKLQLYEEALDIFQSTKDLAIQENSHDLLIAILHNLGRIHFHYGKYDSALSLYQEALTLSKTHHDICHEHVSSTLNCIGVLFSHAIPTGHDKILTAFQQALDICTALGKSNDLQALTIRYNMARCHLKSGTYKDAIHLIEEVRTLRSELLPPSHIDVIITHLHSAMAHDKLGQQDKALDLYRTFLNIFMPIYGHDHEYVEQAEERIADIYVARNEFRKAFDAYFKALRTSMAVRGHHNLKTADMLHRIGLVCNELSDTEGCLAAFKEELSILQHCNIGNDQRTVRAFRNIGRAYCDLGSNSTALEYYQRSLDMQYQLNPRNMLDEAYTHTIMGHVFFQMGRLQDAKHAHGYALKIKISHLGPEHIEVSDILFALGAIHIKENQNQQALETFHKSLIIRRSNKSASVDDLTAVLNQIASIHFEDGNYSDAYIFYQEALVLIKRQNKMDPNALVRALFHVSSVQSRMGHFENSLRHAEEGIKVMDDTIRNVQSFEFDRPIVSSLLNLVGTLYLEKGENERARVSFEQARLYADENHQDHSLFELPVKTKIKFARAA